MPLVQEGSPCTAGKGKKRYHGTWQPDCRVVHIPPPYGNQGGGVAAESCGGLKCVRSMSPGRPVNIRGVTRWVAHGLVVGITGDHDDLTYPGGPLGRY